MRRSYKGCCIMCAMSKGQCKGQGDNTRMHVSELRLLGKKKRTRRNEIPKDQL